MCIGSAGQPGPSGEPGIPNEADLGKTKIVASGVNALNISFPDHADRYLADVFGVKTLARLSLAEGIDYRRYYGDGRVKLVGLSLEGCEKLLTLAVENHSVDITLLRLSLVIESEPGNVWADKLLNWYKVNRPRITVTGKPEKGSYGRYHYKFGDEYSLDHLAVHNYAVATASQDWIVVQSDRLAQNLPVELGFTTLTWQMRGKAAKAALGAVRQLNIPAIYPKMSTQALGKLYIKAMFCAITNQYLEYDFFQVGQFTSIKASYKAIDTTEPEPTIEPETWFHEKGLPKLLRLCEGDRKKAATILMEGVDKLIK